MKQMCASNSPENRCLGGRWVRILKEVLAAAQEGAHQPTLPESKWKMRHQMSAENVWHHYAAAWA